MTLQKDPEGLERKLLHKFVDFTGKRILEIGCGEGRLMWKYASSTKQAIGIDPDRDSLRVATIDRPSDLQKRALFSQASSLYLPFSKENFDSAIFAWSL
jgi:ubiquinone/menaquinone biosynthesis C-methylase UbiE